MMLFAMRMNNANRLMLKASPKKIINLQLFASVCRYYWNYYYSNTVGTKMNTLRFFSRWLQRPTTLCRSCWKQKTSENKSSERGGEGEGYSCVTFNMYAIQILLDLSSLKIVKSARIKLFQQMPWRKCLSRQV